MDKKNENNNSRRKFLKRLGIAAGAGTMVGCGVLSAVAIDKRTKSGEKVKLLSPEGILVEVDKSDMCCEPASPKESRKGLPNKKMVMVIDLGKCRNARECVKGCQKMHYLPPHIEWIKIYLMRNSEDQTPYWFPKPCLHCNNPPCVKVCPVGATFKRTDGIVLIDNERCIGCKFCMAACPYSSRVFHWTEPTTGNELKDIKYSPETSKPGKIGTVSKCDFCPDMVRKGELPSCVTSCPNGVFYYGDKNLDTVTNGTETVRFSEFINERGAYRFMEELGTEPSIYYLPAVNRLFDYNVGFEGLSEEEIALYKKEAHIDE
ncbi:4Fe-4S dicluster domain-containing protein [candidate division KSB1 bacterium]